MSFCLEDLKKQKTIPLTDSEILIGRSNLAAIQIISTLVSRIHAKLKLEENRWKIQDTKSVNGIYVNEKRLKSEGVQILNIGDIISLGPPNKSEFKFRFSQLISLNDSSDYGSPCKKRSKQSFQDNLTKNKYDKKDNSEKKITDCGRIPVQSGDKTENKKCVKLEIKSGNTLFKDNKENVMVIKEIADKEKKSEDLLLSNVNKSENIELFNNDVSKLENNVITEPSETNTKHLKLAIDNLKSMLEEKEKIQEELKRKLLLAEAQLKENKKENTVKEKDDNNHEENCSKEEKPNSLDHVNDIMESELICSICTELFIEAITLNCSHTFCKMCIQLWKKNKKKQVCPVCRTSIKTETPALTINNIIDKMVENLDSEMKEKRKQLTEERLSIAGCSKDNRNNKSVVIISDTDSEISNSDEEENCSCSDSYDSEFSSSPTIDRYFDRCYSCGRTGHYARSCPSKRRYALRNHRY